MLGAAIVITWPVCQKINIAMPLLIKDISLFN